MNANPYRQQLKQQGKEPSTAKAPQKTFPCKIGARVFETEQQYQEALYDFLNAM